ncbi:hypothetical protein SAMN05421785_1119 [Chryseobacterium gambrini]|uniref:Uncharacterized protein n=1 Tax=Chryseobacterium gambrini TaxID=373672 RepID=A0A1N7QEC1_9FLAO|nr:hypothetical protein SAMN05421785_1119 [Chryseobacterium gambrini]
MVFTESSAKSAKSARVLYIYYVISTKEKSIKYNGRDAFQHDKLCSGLSKRKVFLLRMNIFRQQSEGRFHLLRSTLHHPSATEYLCTTLIR